ncbi:MAG: hypothetical protein FWF34_03135, partial [Alphaproteobacteria bacterium]|nr:hypothetical protein [Alphaproteobacteria bacterium]
ILSQMASDGIMRRVIIDGDARPAGDYYIVKYTLVTYDRPNIIDAPPTISRNNEIFLKLKFEKGVREERNGEPFNVKRYLENDGDPAAIFKFQVQEARFQ